MFETGVTILRIRGIPLRLHISLLLFVPYLVFVATTQFVTVARTLGVPEEALRVSPWVWGAVIGLGLFVSIVLHELAHCAVAVAAGAKVHSITLMMLGGVSRMETNVPPEKEAWMAFAGPLTSFGIGFVLYLAYRFAPVSPELAIAILVLGFINIALGVFNLLPAFPMDGGRVLRGLLARKMGRTRATRVATSVGRGTAIVMGLLGLLSYNFILVFIAVFIFMAASAERAFFEAKDALRGIPVSSFMDPRLDDAAPNEMAGDVARRLLVTHRTAAKVSMNGERPGAGPGAGPDKGVGVVTASELVRRAARSKDVSVQSVVRPLPFVHQADDASAALEAFAGDAPAVVVLDERESIVGVVTREDVGRALALGSIR